MVEGAKLPFAALATVRPTSGSRNMTLQVRKQIKYVLTALIFLFLFSSSLLFCRERIPSVLGLNLKWAFCLLIYNYMRFNKLSKKCNYVYKCPICIDYASTY